MGWGIPYSELGVGVVTNKNKLNNNNIPKFNGKKRKSIFELQIFN